MMNQIDFKFLLHLFKISNLGDCVLGTSQILHYCVAKQCYIKNVVHRIT